MRYNSPVVRAVKVLEAQGGSEESLDKMRSRPPHGSDARRGLLAALVFFQIAFLGTSRVSASFYEEGVTSYVPEMRTATQCASVYEVDVTNCPSQVAADTSFCPFDNSTLLAGSTFSQLSCCSNAIATSSACPTDTLGLSSDPFSTLIAEKETFARNLANQARSSVEGRCFSLSSCGADCSYKSCSTDVGTTGCVKRFGTLPDCPSSDPTNCNGRKLNFDKSSILLASEGGDRTSQDEFVCGTRNLDSFFKTSHTTDLMWTYFGDIYGQMRIYPGYARERDSTGCKAYDPRIRPWYLAASSGPKDVVIVLDVSGSMNQYAQSTKSRIQIIKDTLNGHDGRAGLLDTFSFADYISIVLFSGEASVLQIDSAQSDLLLVQATAANIAKAKSAVANIGASGSTSFRAGFEKAFSVLTESAKNEGHTSSCSSVVLFLTDGRDNACEQCSSEYRDEHGACKCTENMLETVKSHQSSLVGAGGKRATIFTYSMGTGADDSIPRSIACSNGGAWGSIADGEDPITKMTGYYKFMARSNINADSVFWTEPYADDPTGLQVTTAAKVVYESTGGKHMLGVVGVDVPLQALDANYNASYQNMFNALQMRSRACWFNTPDNCEMQMLRGGSSCAQSLPKEACCFRPEKTTKVFLKVAYARSHRDAEAYCKAQFPADGTLAVPENAREYEFMSGIVPSDGAWIGLKQLTTATEPAGDWQWAQTTSFPVDANLWAAGEPNNYDNSEHCAEMDSRGSTNNVNDEDCDKKLPFICQTMVPSADFIGKCMDCAANFGASTTPTTRSSSSSGSSSSSSLLPAILASIGGVAVVALGGGLYYKNRRSTNVTVACCSSGVNVKTSNRLGDRNGADEDAKREEERGRADSSPRVVQPQVPTNYGYGQQQPAVYQQPVVCQQQQPATQVYYTGQPTAPAYGTQYPNMN